LSFIADSFKLRKNLKKLYLKLNGCCINTHDCRKLINNFSFLKNLTILSLDFSENAIDDDFFV